MCCVAHPSVLLSMLLLVEASCLGGRSCLHHVAAKVEGMYLCGNNYSQGRYLLLPKWEEISSRLKSQERASVTLFFFPGNHCKYSLILWWMKRLTCFLAILRHVVALIGSIASSEKKSASAILRTWCCPLSITHNPQVGGILTSYLSMVWWLRWWIWEGYWMRASGTVLGVPVSMQNLCANNLLVQKGKNWICRYVMGAGRRWDSCQCPWMLSWGKASLIQGPPSKAVGWQWIFFSLLSAGGLWVCFKNGRQSV